MAPAELATCKPFLDPVGISPNLQPAPMAIAGALVAPSPRVVAAGPLKRPLLAGKALSGLQARAPRRTRAARLLAQAVSAKAATQTYICVDCGWIYDNAEGPFEKLPSGYRCPVCSAPKRRFKPYAGSAARNDARSMNARYEQMQRGGGGAKGSGAGGGPAVGLLAAGAVALVGVYLYLSSVYN